MKPGLGGILFALGLFDRCFCEMQTGAFKNFSWQGKMCAPDLKIREQMLAAIQRKKKKINNSAPLGNVY